MKNIKYISFLLLIMSVISCVKDPLEEIDEGNWNKERNVLNILFNGQVGEAEIIRIGDIATINFTYNTSAGTDLSSVKIDELEISFGASTSVSAGETLNFENESNSAIITITPANGDPLDWVVVLTPFTETILGAWDISGLYVYGGTGPVYGGAAVIKMTDKYWCWSTVGGPAVEEDNTLTFSMDGITDEGNTYGTVVNNAGADNKYADFIYVLSDPSIDLNHNYRAIPKGEGTWLRNYSDGTVTFTFSDGSTRVASFDAPGAYDLGDGQSRTLTNYAFAFTLSGVDDWDHIYTDYDKFVSRPRKYWVDISKQ